MFSFQLGLLCRLWLWPLRVCGGFRPARSLVPWGSATKMAKPTPDRTGEKGKRHHRAPKNNTARKPAKGASETANREKITESVLPGAFCPRLGFGAGILSFARPLTPAFPTLHRPAGAMRLPARRVYFTLVHFPGCLLYFFDSALYLHRLKLSVFRMPLLLLLAACFSLTSPTPFLCSLFVCF